MLSSAASQPCTMPEASDFPEYVLLDTIGHIRIGLCDDNATMVAGKTSAGRPFKVSFEIAEPPLLSRFFVHFPDLTSVDPKVSARVTGADAAFLLIRLAYPDLAGSWRMVSDVFIYRVAAPPGTPSLYLVPRPGLTGLLADHVAVLSCDDDDDDVVTGKKGANCLVIIPKRQFDSYGYDLHIFSTKTGLWSTRFAEASRDLAGYLLAVFRQHGHHIRLRPTRVFSLGGGLMAWVDFRHGIQLCNVLVEEPEMNLIELGPLMGSNEELFEPNMDGGLPPADQIRDVTFRDGRFRFVEMEYTELFGEGSLMDLRYRATMFTRTMESQVWEQYRAFDSAELSPADSCFPLSFPKIWDCKRGKLTLNRTINCSIPTLDMYRDDVVYMMTKLEARDHNGWVLAVNTLSNKVEKTEPFSAERPYVDHTLLQCAFFNYFRKVEI